MQQNTTPEEPKMSESAERIGFVECHMKGNAAKWVMQLTYPQCYFQVHEFESTLHYLDTLGKSDKWVHAQVGSRTMAITFNGCMMHYAFGQDDASERAQQLISALKEAARWYDGYLEDYKTLEVMDKLLERQCPKSRCFRLRELFIKMLPKVLSL